MKMNQLCLAVLMVLGLAACGGRSSHDAPKPKTDVGQEMPKKNPEQQQKAPEKKAEEPKKENKPHLPTPEAGGKNPPKKPEQKKPDSEKKDENKNNGAPQTPKKPETTEPKFLKPLTNSSPASRIITLRSSNGSTVEKQWFVPELKAGQWMDDTVDGKKVQFSGYDETIFGFIGDQKFFNGQLTQKDKVPSGKVSYHGIGLLKDQSPGQAASFSKLDVKLEADFGAKTLKGTLTGSKAQDKFDIDAVIDGSVFQKTTGDIRVSGGFYGPNAGELAGEFEKRTSFQEGVFGAKKQN